MSSTTQYIPPAGLFFRLYNADTTWVIAAHTHLEPQITSHSFTKLFDDQFFSLISGTGARAGKYTLKNKFTGMVLYSRDHTEPRIGHDNKNGTYDDNYFTIEQGTGKYASQFRLVSGGNKLVLAMARSAPWVHNPSASTQDADQYFSFLFEDVKIESVKYDIKRGVIMASTPIVLASQVLNNSKSDVPQEMSYSMNKTKTHTSSFQAMVGFSLSVGAKGKAGVPFVAEGEVLVDATASTEFTWGKKTATAQAYTGLFPVKAGPHQVVKAVSTIHRGTLEVPYTIHLKSKNGVKTINKGIWKGVSTWDLRHTIEVMKK